MATTDSTTGRHRWTPMLWAALPVAVLAISVGVSRSGIDVLLVAIVCLLLLGLERTAGDWLGELVGSTLAGVIFASAGVGCLWYFFFSATGSAHTTRFFAAAEERGFSTTYYNTRPPDPNLLPPSTPASASTSESDEAARPSPTASAPNAVRSATSERTAAPPPAAKGPVIETTFSSMLPWQRNEAPPPRATAIVISAEPSRILLGRRSVLQAQVTVDGQAVREGIVDFSVDGIGAGASHVDVRGTADTTYSTFIAGTHSVIARFTGTRNLAASLSEPISLVVSAK